MENDPWIRIHGERVVAILLVVYLHTNYWDILHRPYSLNHLFRSREHFWFGWRSCWCFRYFPKRRFLTLGCSCATGILPFFKSREFGGARVCSDLSQAIARKPGTGRDLETWMIPDGLWAVRLHSKMLSAFFTCPKRWKNDSYARGVIENLLWNSLELRHLKKRMVASCKTAFLSGS